MLALLPTATTNVLAALNTEQITYEIQQIKGVTKGIKAGSTESTASPPSIADTTMTEEDGKSMASLQSESGVHASQVVAPSPFAASGDAGQQDGGAQRSRKTKRQLWDDLTISSTSACPGPCHFPDADHAGFQPSQEPLPSFTPSPS